MSEDGLWALIWVLTPLSLLSIGGGSAIIAGLEAEVVQHHGWVSSREFLHMFAITRAAPGPGTMLATLIGWKIAGWAGAFVATLALFLPSSLLAYAVFRSSNRYRHYRWHRLAREGLAPVGTGLMIAGIMAIFRLSGGGLVAVVIAAGTAALLYRLPRCPVILVLLGGGVVHVAIRVLIVA